MLSGGGKGIPRLVYQRGDVAQEDLLIFNKRRQG